MLTSAYRRDRKERLLLIVVNWELVQISGTVSVFFSGRQERHKGKERRKRKTSRVSRKSERKARHRSDSRRHGSRSR